MSALPEAPDHGIGRRMASGAIWLVALRFAVRGLGMLSLLITAPLLTPADFGLVVLATGIAELLDITSDFSLDLALIRDRRAGRAEYDTAFTLHLIKSALIALLLVAAAEPAAIFFEDPRLGPVVVCLALVSLAGGLMNIGAVDFRRDLELGKEFALQFWAKGAAFVTALALAWLWRTYWALVAAIVVRRLVMVAMSYGLSDYRPRLSLAAWRHLLGVSKWLLLNNLLMFVRERMDTLVIGKLAGPGPLGLYTIAREIADLPTTELAGPASRAIYPGYARLADDRQRLARNYLDTFSVMMLISIPASTGIALIAQPMIQLWLGPAWQGSAPLIQALVAFGLCRTAYANAGAIYLALGRMRIEPALMLVHIVLLAPLLYVLLPAYGILGAAFGLTATAAVSLVLNKLMLCRLLGLRLAEIVATIWRPAAASFAMAVLVVFVPRPFNDELGQLFWILALGSAGFLGSLAVFWHLSGRPRGPEQQLLGFLLPTLRRWRPAAQAGLSGS